MKSKHLAILGAIVAVLLALKLVVSRHDRQVASDLSDAGIARLLPDSLKASDVRWVRVSSPGDGADAKSFKVVRGSGSEWVLASAQNAPADATIVNTFVESAVALSGEERGSGKDHFADFGVDDAHAVKVELGAADAEKPAATLWLGKSGDRQGAHFVRVEGSDAVSHVGQGLRASLGLWSDTAKLDPDHWLKKELLKVDGASIKTIDVWRPDVRYAFAQHEEAPTAATGKEAASPAPPAKTWSVTTPTGLAWSVRKDALSGTLGRVGTVRIDGMAPAESCAAAQTSAKVTITDDAGASHEIRVGAKVPDKDAVGLQVDTDPHCYRVSSYSVQDVAPRASSVFDVPAVLTDAPPAKDVKSATYSRDGVTVRLTQPEEGKWTADGHSADASRASRLVGAATSLRVDDLAEASHVPAALLKPEATLTLQASGKSLSVTILGKRLGGIGEERYVRVQGIPAGYVGVVNDSTAQSLLATPKDLGK